MTSGLLERRVPWRDGDLDRSVWAEIVAIGSMTLGVPVPNASPYLTHKIEAALVGQVSEIANQICNGMLIAHTTMLLESCNRVGGPGYVANFVDHTNKPTMMRRFVFDARTISSPTSSVSLRRQCRCRSWQIEGWPPRYGARPCAASKSVTGAELRPKHEKKAMTIKSCILAAVGMLTLGIAAPCAQSSIVQRAKPDNKNWQAVALGLVEPRSGDIKMMAPLIGIVSQVLVLTGDKVIADEPLIRIEDEEAQARIATLQTQVEMRERARNDQRAGKAANR